MNNWHEWQEYVNGELDKFEVWRLQRERDITNEQMRIQRSLDAALQEIGSLREELAKTGIDPKAVR